MVIGGDIVRIVPERIDLGPLLFALHTRDLFDVVENEIVNNADYSTILAVANSPMYRIFGTEILKFDLVAIKTIVICMEHESEW